MTRTTAVGRKTTDNALLLLGRANDDARIVHHAAQNPPGDFTVIAAVEPHNGGSAVLGKGFIGAAQFGTSILPGNILTLAVSRDGTTNTTAAQSTVAAPYDVGEPFYYKATYDADNGASGNDVEFFTAPYSSVRPAVDSDVWTKLGDTVTTAGTGTTYASTMVVDIGTSLTGIFDFGKIRIFDVVWLDADGDAIVDIDFRSQPEGTTSFTEASPNGYTVSVRNNARIGGRETPVGRVAPVGREKIYTWHDIIEGVHSWDALDAVTYESEGDYSETGTRIDYVPDMGTDGTNNLVRDAGSWAAFWDLGYTPPGSVPGPLYYENMSRFNGRAGWDCDDLGHLWRGFFAGGNNAHGGLTTMPSVTVESEYFNEGDGIQQPYVVMGLGSINESGHAVLIDSLSGGMTVGADDTDDTKWGVTTEFGDPWPATTHPVVVGQTVFFMVRADGANSWLELVTRNASGTIVRDRQSITLDSQTPPDEAYRNLWLGQVHAVSMSALKIIDSVPSDSDLTRVVDWVSPYISNAVA